MGGRRKAGVHDTARGRAYWPGQSGGGTVGDELGREQLVPEGPRPL